MLLGLPQFLRAVFLFIAAVPLLAGAGHWPAEHADKRYGDLFIFGDSLTDTGDRAPASWRESEAGDDSPDGIR